MIDPLRFCKENATPIQVDQVMYCELCVQLRRKTKNLAILSCCECAKRYLCKICDASVHSLDENKLHVRKTILVGPGVRKNVIVRGDAVNFPHSLDVVDIRFKAQIFHDGKVVGNEPWKFANFRVGLSGLSVHVQVLGARNLIAADLNQTSDPFVQAVYYDKCYGRTRVKPRNLNPNWENETFVVPMDPNFSAPRYASNSQKNLFKLEVYDYDWFGQNDFLGHVEMSRKELYDLAVSSNEKPICLPLYTNEFHGILGLKLGQCDQYLYISIDRAENLNKINFYQQNCPYVKVYFDNQLLGITSVFSEDEASPTWTKNNVFQIKINDVIRREQYIIRKKREVFLKKRSLSSRFEGTKRRGSGSKPLWKETAQKNIARLVSIFVSEEPAERGHVNEDLLLLFRLEICNSSRWNKHSIIGTARVGIELLRTMLPTFPRVYIVEREVATTRASVRVQAVESLASRAIRRMTSLKLLFQAKITKQPEKEDDRFIDNVDDYSLHGYVSQEVLNQWGQPEYDPVFATKSGSVTEAKVLREEEEQFLQQQAEEMSRRTIKGRRDSFVDIGATLGALKRQSTQAPPSPTALAGQMDKLSDVIYEESSESESGSESESDSQSESCAEPEVFSIHASSYSSKLKRARESASPEATPPTPSAVEEGAADQAEDEEAAADQAGVKPQRRSCQEYFGSVLAMFGWRRGYEPSEDEDGDGEGAGEGQDSDDEESDDGEKKLFNFDFAAKKSALMANLAVKKAACASCLVRSGAAISSASIEAAAALRDAATRLCDSVLPYRRHLGDAIEALKKNISTEADYSNVRWGRIRHFIIESETSKNTASLELSDRGFLVVRLLLSQRGCTTSGLDTAVRHMSLGETAEVKVRYDFAFGNFCQSAALTPRANIVYTVELQLINGRGQLAVAYRQCKRALRGLGRSCLRLLRWLRWADEAGRARLARWRGQGEEDGLLEEGSQYEVRCDRLFRRRLPPRRRWRWRSRRSAGRPGRTRSPPPAACASWPTPRRG